MARVELHAKQAPPSTPHWPVVRLVTHVEPAQQPAPQVVESQPVQARLVQVCPPAQAAQVAPLFPHDEPLVPARHAVPWQQPVGHEVESQTHVSPTQRWPAPQVVPPGPQLHAPLRQRSDVVGSQVPHAVPFAPHAVELCAPDVTHATGEVLQHPFAHELGVQAQTPPLHTRPGPHGFPAPHAHSPSLQRSALAPHEPQVAPPVPHAERVVEVTQVPAEQQPLGQLVASQTHVPPTQRLPEPHAGPPPHPHVPFARQASVCDVEHETQVPASRPQLVEVGDETHWLPVQHPAQLVELHTHVLPTHCWPGWQAGPVPHEQTPLRQLEAVSELQLPHAAPARPQVPCDCCEVMTHTPF